MQALHITQRHPTAAGISIINSEEPNIARLFFSETKLRVAALTLISILVLAMKLPRFFALLSLISCGVLQVLRAQAPHVPDWALPGSSTHQQVPPPVNFHRPAVTFAEPIGLFAGQTDIGGPLLPGSATFDAVTKSYTINSASYNIWYTRDELRFLWQKMSGDVSLAADVTFPNPKGYDDRKAVLIIRQSLDDDSKEIMTALHGAGLIHLAQRPEKGANLKEDYRSKGDAAKAGESPIRLGLEKHGNFFTLFVSLKGEPMHQVGAPVELHFDAPFYVGIGFCSHVPDKSDTTILSNLVFENSAGKVR